MKLRGSCYFPHVFGYASTPAASLLRLPASLRVLRLDAKHAPHDFIATISAASLGNLANLDLLCITALDLQFPLPAAASLAVGPCRLRLTVQRLNVLLPDTAVPESRSRGVSAEAHLMECFSRLFGGSSSVSLVSRQKGTGYWSRYRFNFWLLGEEHRLYYESVADLTGALQPHAAQHGFRLHTMVTADEEEFVLERMVL